MLSEGTTRLGCGIGGEDRHLADHDLVVLHRQYAAPGWVLSMHDAPFVLALNHGVSLADNAGMSWAQLYGRHRCSMSPTNGAFRFQESVQAGI